MGDFINKVYDPSLVEQEIYDLWNKNRLFKINFDSQKKAYSIVLPPPNITGVLHMGHALNFTLQDILARFKRMMGFEIVWIPGTDHAAISTEAKVVESLTKENLTKQSIGYNEFMDRCWKWKEQYGNTISQQIRSLGASCDWSKERFTLDEGCSKAVNEFFVRLYEEGLIYRGNRIVNWCPNCNTSISDIEVDYKESESDLVYLKYYLLGKDEFLTISTTRPETIFGDSAVAVNPNDKRYSKFIGKKVLIPILNKEIEIIPDECVDMEFGTGVLKVTPCHDFTDFEIGERHNLEKISVIKTDGKLNDKCGKYSGLQSNQARKIIINDLSEQGFVVKIEKIKNNVGKCSRCGYVIEPLTSNQWFVKMKELSIPAIDAVKTGEVKFIPERFSKVYMHWMENIKDWCISRQIWWGHPIPAWFCKDCDHINVSRSEVSSCEKCGSTNLKKDNDSLDTWFSSALWSFSVLGWPETTEMIDKIYPDDTVITGYDIIFFWIARMIFSSIKMIKKIPFRNVVIHGLVRDAQGRKMSKSLGNGINPLDIISQYGTDALRLSLVTGLTAGNDTRFSQDKLEGNRNFINKIWNAARFIKMNGGHRGDNLSTINPYDYWIFHKINSTISEVTNNMEKFEFGLSLQKIYSLFWDNFCDWYLEFSKISFKKDNSSINTCCYVFCQILKLLHPFIPFVTEKIWKFFNNDFLMISSYPKCNFNLENKDEYEKVERLISVIHSIRAKRNEMNTPHNKKITIYVYSNEENESLVKFFTDFSDPIETLAGVGIIRMGRKTEMEMSAIVLDFVKIMIPVEDLTNKEELKLKLSKEIKELEQKILKNKNLLDSNSFMEKAPQKVIDNVINSLKSDKLKLYELKEKLL